MIENLRGFPNQAIPAVYGESLSYTQQVAYLMKKVQECIDYLNNLDLAEVPKPKDGDVGKIAEVYLDSQGQLAVKWSNTYREDITAIEGDIDDIQGDVEDLQEDLAALEIEEAEDVASLDADKQKEIITLTGTLQPGSWVNNYETVTVEGIGANDILVVSAPSNDDVSNAQFAENQIRAYSQSTDTITFKCGSVPSEVVHFVVMVVKPNPAE